MTGLPTTAAGSPPGLASALRAEARKLATVRSTYVLLLLVVALGVGVGLLELTSLGHNWVSMSPADRAAVDPVSESFSGLQVAELALGALGVLAVSPECGSGMIRATFVAMPRRGRVFLAKALVLTATHPVTRPHAARVPSLGLAYLDLVLYLVAFLGLGAWRMRRDPGA